VIQGQDGKVTCEAEGASVATLLWKKETNSGDVDVPKSWVTNIVNRATNRVQAVPQDYKCYVGRCWCLQMYSAGPG